MSDQEQKDEVLRYFGLAQDGNPTEVIIIEYKSGNIGIELQTKRDGMEKLVTPMILRPNTFSMLFDAMVRAAHDQAVWNAPVSKKDEVSE